MEFFMKRIFAFVSACLFYFPAVNPVVQIMEDRVAVAAARIAVALQNPSLQM